MFRGILLGDLWGIEEDVWVQLWSGAIGAIPAALLAAWVAVSVLRRSNRYQQELVERQLAVQRQEAALSREKAATADVVAVANGFLSVLDEGPDAVQRQALAFRAACFRWQIEIEDLDLILDLVLWANVLADAANGHLIEKVTPGSTIENEWRKALTASISSIFAFSLGWYRLPDDRLNTVAGLKKRRGELEEQIKALSRKDATAGA